MDVIGAVILVTKNKLIVKYYKYSYNEKKN